MLLAAVLLGVAAAVAACNGGSSKDSTSSKATASPAVTASSGVSPVPGKTAEATSPPSGRVSDEPVAFQTDDGVTLRGHLYTVPGPRRKAVIFAHMYPNDQRAWTAFAMEMAQSGVAALTFDFRGYGESGGSKDVAKIDHDLTYALLFMKSRDYPEIYLVGASMGGTAALKVAAAQEVSGLVTVSAPLSFMGLDATADVARISAPKLFLASKSEAEGGGQAAQQLAQAATGPKDLYLFDGSAHGTDLLKGPNADLFKQKVAEFVQGH